MRPSVIEKRFMALVPGVDGMLPLCWPIVDAAKSLLMIIWQSLAHTVVT